MRVPEGSSVDTEQAGQGLPSTCQWLTELDGPPALPHLPQWTTHPSPPATVDHPPFPTCHSGPASSQHHGSSRMFWIQPTTEFTLGGTPGPGQQLRAWLAESEPWQSVLWQCLPPAAASSLPSSVPSSVSFPRPFSPLGTTQGWPPAPES